MPSWLAPAIGAGVGALGGLFGGGGEEQETKLDPLTQAIMGQLFAARGFDPSEYGISNVWKLPTQTYGPRVHQGPTPEVQSILQTLMNRQPSPYEQAAQTYGTKAISGDFLGVNPGMYALAPMAYGTPATNPYLRNLVHQAQRRTGRNVATMFGRSGMGGSSLENQVATRQMGDIASQMYGRAYETDMNRQLQAAGQLGNLWAGERSLQQEAAFNAQRLADLDWTNLRNRLAAAQGMEQYGVQQRQEAQAAHRYGQQAPYNRLGFITSAFMGAPQGSTTTSEVTPNLFAMGLGGALAGAGIWRGMQQPSPPPYQTGGGYTRPYYGPGYTQMGYGFGRV